VVDNMRHFLAGRPGDMRNIVARASAAPTGSH